MYASDHNFPPGGKPSEEGASRLDEGVQHADEGGGKLADDGEGHTDEGEEEGARGAGRSPPGGSGGGGGGGGRDGARHDHHDHHASFVDMSGNFVTDDFIEALLGFKAGDPSLKVRDPEDEEAAETASSPEGIYSPGDASKRASSPSPSSRPTSPQPLLNPKTVRLRVDKLREDVNAKRAADKAAQAALANAQAALADAQANPLYPSPSS